MSADPTDPTASPVLCRRAFLAGAAAAATLALTPFAGAEPSGADEKLRAALLLLAQANRVLAHEGLLDMNGHVSVRHPVRPDRYLLSRSLAAALVSRADLLEFDLDNNPVQPTKQTLYLERAIHGSIYRARPDVHCVIHSHVPDVLPFTVVRTRLRPIINSAAMLGATIPFWDTRDEFGDTDTLVATPEIGRSLAKTLGDNQAVLMRSHGCVVVGASIPQAVQRAVILKLNARVQLEASRLGEPIFMSEGEIAKTAPLWSNPAIAVRPWEYFLSRADLGGI